ncbi:PXMP2/4 family protein 4 [Linum perenne]
MSGTFMSKSSVLRILRSQTIARIADPTAAAASATTSTIHGLLKNQTTTPSGAQYYLRLPSHYFRKSSNDVSPSALFSSAFSSSSSSTSTSTASSASRIPFISWYLDMVKARPILTKSVTASFIYTAADLSSQTISKASSVPYDYDLTRTSRMAGYGLLILGPSLHFWFNFVSKLFPNRDMVATLKKMAMGQAIYGPIMTVVFFSTIARLQGENGAEIMARLKRDLLPTMLNGVMYWPLCDFITFRFIPVHLQPLVSNSFSYLWTVYMTYMAGKEKVTAAT